MIRKCLLTKAILLSALVWTCMLVHPATTRAQAPADQAKPTYTIPEYNAFQAANAEKDPTARLKLLDDFGAKFPSSTLNPYVYQLYIKTYTDLKNYPKVIEYADKVIATRRQSGRGREAAGVAGALPGVPICLQRESS